MPHLTSHPLTARPTSFHRGPTRPRRKLMETLAAIVDSAFSPGGAAAHGTPALQAREVQERLLAVGLLPADALTGRYDRRTLDAVARFQASQGLPVDGIPDQATADALLRG